MRKAILSMQMTLDGFIEGPNGELDWAMAEDEEAWKDVFAMFQSVDTCIQGRDDVDWLVDGLSSGKNEFWRA